MEYFISNGTRLINWIRQRSLLRSIPSEELFGTIVYWCWACQPKLGSFLLQNCGNLPIYPFKLKKLDDGVKCTGHTLHRYQSFLTVFPLKSFIFFYAALSSCLHDGKQVCSLSPLSFVACLQGWIGSKKKHAWWQKRQMTISILDSYYWSSVTFFKKIFI